MTDFIPTHTSTPEEVRDWLRERKDELGLTIQEMADMIGRDSRTIDRYLSDGTSNPKSIRILRDTFADEEAAEIAKAVTLIKQEIAKFADETFLVSQIRNYGPPSYEEMSFEDFFAFHGYEYEISTDALNGHKPSLLEEVKDSGYCDESMLRAEVERVLTTNYNSYGDVTKVVWDAFDFEMLGSVSEDWRNPFDRNFCEEEIVDWLERKDAPFTLELCTQLRETCFDFTDVVYSGELSDEQSEWLAQDFCDTNGISRKWVG